jgi:hypothetical protein
LGTGKSACATRGECFAISLFAVIGGGHENVLFPIRLQKLSMRRLIRRLTDCALDGGAI